MGEEKAGRAKPVLLVSKNIPGNIHSGYRPDERAFQTLRDDQVFRHENQHLTRYLNFIKNVTKLTVFR